ncbi:hemolysin-III related-domain-containing protein [Cokeromyces recurvatus]|uniref:hemolysin-III related-domain-containing protein n=1 Tax=Cokeromyces recurvatus TaxID=90255 RepID=UPI002220C75E|nr:hemolysin-III related-domain-containing protein [Cokeromyces recurvatus]KAI7907332.1 hemolysin-III related-domain-containing protein [Cokeromyces recurvatus]
MENLLTIRPQSVLHHDDNLDLDDFFKNNLEPLMKKFKYRLSQFESHRVVKSERFQTYTATKIKTAYLLLDNFVSKWEEHYKNAIEVRHKVLQQLDDNVKTSDDYYHMITPPDLIRAMLELSKKYHELEMDSSGEMMDKTIDAFMVKMEELDGKISDALGCADKMRERLESKLMEVAGVANEHIDKLKNAVSYGTTRLLTYDELPTPWQSNQYIRTGYRFLESAADCWYSLFYIHNESGNIWTHLLGFITLFSIGVYELFFSELMTSIPIKDRIVFLIFFLAACKCLMCSTVWHTLSGINNLKVYHQVACLDYVGISVLICASIILCEYYGFYCQDVIRNTYITATSTLAVIGVSMPFQAWFDRQDCRWLRIAFFVALASSSAFIIAHLSIVRGVYETFNWLTPVFKSIACYLVGVIIYGNQFPERFWPGKFDHLGHSHQFWHIFVCGGIWFHYQAALQFAAKRELFSQCPLINP